MFKTLTLAIAFAAVAAAAAPAHAEWPITTNSLICERASITLSTPSRPMPRSMAG